MVPLHGDMVASHNGGPRHRASCVRASHGCPCHPQALPPPSWLAAASTGIAMLVGTRCGCRRDPGCCPAVCGAGSGCVMLRTGRVRGPCVPQPLQGHGTALVPLCIRRQGCHRRQHRSRAAGSS